ncbi:MAG: hypothetical protein JW913_19135 [Chitinispirillaceae bacterium]|nr:hypothetical protein [Chitinispirillaceae bacterium]
MLRAYNVLVCNPYITDFKLYDEWMHPLGLYFLIDLLTANGADVHYFDCLERSPGAPLKKFGTGSFTSRVIPRPAVPSPAAPAPAQETASPQDL